MRRFSARAVASLALLAVFAAHAAADSTPGRSGAERVPFDGLFRKLTRLTHATVSIACGSSVAPWAYRGTRGQATALRAAFTAEADEAWTRRFVRTLMRPADWDTAMRCTSPGHPCDADSTSPMFVVTLRGRPDTYALLLFDARCAVVFEADRALGSMAMNDRADSLFALVQEVLPAAARTPAIPTASADWAAADTVLGFGQHADLDSLPSVVSKVAPIYPARARLAAAEGVVWVQALVGRDGVVRDAFAVRPMPYLDNAALDAVWQWTFRPALRRGSPIAVWVLVPVRFTLH